MKLCSFVTRKVSEGRWHHRCSDCGYEEEIDTERFYHPCGRQDLPQAPLPCCGGNGRANAPARELPTWRQMGRTLRLAYRGWKKAGKPVRSAARSKEIFENHCAFCEHLHRDGPSSAARCGLCGCYLLEIQNRAIHALGVPAKIVMATEGCPKLPPEFVADA